MADHSDLGFVPDTKDHADLGFTPEQIAPESGALRTIKDAGIGAASGITLGASPIIGGAAEATEDVLTGDTKLQDWVQKYRQHQQELQQDLKDAKERSPIATTTGEIAGGLALPMGSLGLAGKGLGMAGKAALAGGVGAASGAMSSEGELGSKQMLKDALIGGGIAALGGAALETAGPAIGKGLSKLSDKTGLTSFIENNPTVRQGLIPLKEGLAGRGFFGDINAEQRAGELKTAASELANPLNKLTDVVNDKYTQVLQGQNVSLTPQLQNDLALTQKTLNAKKINIGLSPEDIPSSEGLIPTGEKMGIQQKIDAALNNQTGQIPAQDLKDIQKFARDEMYSLHGGEASDILDSLNKTATAHLNQVPGYTQVNSQFGDVADTLKSFAKKVPTEQLAMGGPKTTGEKIYKTAEDVVSKATLPYDVGKKQASQLSSLQDSLTKLAQSDPEMLQTAGIKDIPSFIKNAKNAADIQAVTKTLRSTGQMGQGGVIGSLGGGTIAGTQAATLGIGRVTNAFSNSGAWLAKQPSQSLTPLAKMLSSSPATSHMGEALANAIATTAENPGSISKNAALFTILQNPAGRKAVQEIFPSGEEEGTQK